MMKNAFCFTIKALFVLKKENGLIRKICLISKSITSQPDQQTIAIYILTNISRSKDNQSMKAGQLSRI